LGLSATAEDLYKNKIRIIYEYNRNSPLFARIANWELENNNHEAAIEILKEGLRENPDFPTPYFILGRAYCKTGDFSKALKCFKKGSELIHFRETYQFYLRELDSMRSSQMSPELRALASLERKKEKSFQKKENERSAQLEDNLDELADKISRAKIPVITEEDSSSKYVANEIPESSLIVSETLAKIYLAQGEIKEAIIIYEKLSKKEPSRLEYFSQRISELKSKL